MASQSRLGRPPATNSTETRARILEAARRKFGAHGYESASNRALADEAGLTSGAIYHYFNSKLDIYVAVYIDARDLAYDRFEKAIVGLDSFAEQLQATLEAAHELNIEDPTLAQFLGSARVDASRNPDLADAMRQADREGPALFERIIDFGIETGEVDPADRGIISALVRTITAGLTDAVSADPVRHRMAVDGINRLLSGSLLNPPTK